MRPLTVQEACAFLKMEKSTLHKLMRLQAFPYYRRPESRVILFDQDELEQWLRSGRVPAGNERQEPSQQYEVNTPAIFTTILDIVPRKVYHRNPCYR